MARLNLDMPMDGESREKNDDKRKQRNGTLTGLDERLTIQVLFMDHLWNECVTLQFLSAHSALLNFWII
jgi:hypothetical protein